MSMKITVGANVGHAPKRLASDSFFKAVRTGFSSATYAQATEERQKQEYIEGFVAMGFTKAQAEAMYNGE